MASDVSAGPVAEFCAGLKQLRRESGGDAVALARQLKLSKAQLYAILNGEIKRPPDWTRVVQPLVHACTGGDAKALAEWRQRHAVLVRVWEELRRRDRLAGQTAPRASSVSPPKAVRSPEADTAAFTGRADQIDKITRAAADGQGVAVPRTLPRTIASFTGRESELRQLADVVAGQGGAVGICTIAGMAGVGKTSLALHAAHQAASRFPDGQLFLDLHGHTAGLEPLTAQEALSSLLGSLGTPQQAIPEDTEERAAFYRSRLAGTRTLIILDNAASTAQVKPLLPGTAGCLVIVTSRRSLPGLDDAQALALEVLPEADAAALFAAIAGPGRIPDDDPSLAEIIALCEYLPLAIRIIAARLSNRKALRTADIVEQLRHEHSRLAQLQDEDRSLAAVFDLSYRHLPGPQQHLFGHLGLNPGPDVTAHAAANLIDTDLADADRLLESLLDHNLLIQRIPGRYRFHDLVRAYARTITSNTASGDPDAAPGVSPAIDSAGALDRLLDYYLHTAQSADRHFERRLPRIHEPDAVARPRTGPSIENLEHARAWMSAELANLDAAAHSAASHGRAAHAIALPASLAQFLRDNGLWSQAIDLHRLALHTARDIGDQPAQAGALAHLGTAQRLVNAFEQAEDCLTRAVDLYRELGNRHGQAGALAELAIVQRLTGMYPGAEARLGEALDLYRDLGNRHGQAGALAEFGVVQQQRGSFTLAADTLTQALGFYRGLGNRSGEAGTLAYLGGVQCSTQAFTSAEDTLTQALELYRELGDRNGQANALLFLGVAYQEAGDYLQAKEMLAAALTLYDELAEHRGKAGVLVYLGVLHGLTEEYTEADDCLTQALNLFRELHDRGGEAEALNHYARLIAITSTPGKARAQFSEALRLAQKISSSKDEADALDGIAVTYRSEGNTTEAKGHFQQALTLYRSLDCMTDATRVEAALASLEND